MGKSYRAVYILITLILLVSALLPANAVSDSYTTVTSRLKAMSGSSAPLAKIGSSSQGRPIYAVAITARGSSGSVTSEKRRVLVISGQHGNEKTPVFAMLDLIGSLTSNSQKENQDTLRDVVIIFVPVANPDGFASNRRCCASGIDLNRDWQTQSQPETRTIAQLVKQLHPHVILDLHEWTQQDPMQSNCVEAAGFDNSIHQQLSRSLARLTLRSTTAGGLALDPIYYSPGADSRLAHRWFTDQGICSMLVETRPNQSSIVRRNVYRTAVMTVAHALSSPADSEVSKNLALVQIGTPEGSSWLATLYPKPVRKHRPLGLDVCWLAILSAIAYILVRQTFEQKAQLTSGKRRIRMELPTLRPFSMTEAVMADTSMRTRLAIIQQYRIRPTARCKTENSG